MEDLGSFSCSSKDLSHTNLTLEVWSIVNASNLLKDSVLVLAVLTLLIVAVGIPWNATVLVTVAVKQYKGSTYILLANLVAADLLLGLFIIFHIVSAFKQEFTIGNTDYDRCQACHAIVISGTALSHVSGFILTLLSVDRLVYIQWPFQYSKYTNIKMIIFSLLSVWILSIAFSIPPIFGFGEIKFDVKSGFCGIHVLGNTSITANSSYVLFLIAVNSIPCLVTIAANVWLLIITCNNVAKRRKRQVRSVKNTFHSFRTKMSQEKIVTSNFHKEQAHLARIFGALFFVNVITWIPVFSLIIVQLIIGDAGGIPIPVFTLAFLSLVSQPTLHPILETCLMGKVRTTILSSICSHCKTFKGSK